MKEALVSYLSWLRDARSCIEATGRRDAFSKKYINGREANKQNTDRWLFRVNTEIRLTINKLTNL